MKAIKFLKIKNWLTTVRQKKVFFSGIGQLLIQVMTGRKFDDDTNEVPHKKLCAEGQKNVSTPRVKKRNVAVLLSYSGVNYFGMQINIGYKTIEEELLKALCKDNAIPAEALKNLSSISFQRAARTDKNVSAVRQVVSFYIADNFSIDNINSHLPEEIRVFSIKRVTKGFNSKNFCHARTYSYTLPTFALASELHEEFPENFRVDKETIQKVDDILQSYVGSNLYHNFTVKKNHDDPSARRYIMSFKSETPFIENGEEFITLTVKGQSFMLHQIRKMVGHLIGILKGKAPENIIKNVWGAEKYAVPMAPGLGLVLEDLHFDAYNKKYGTDGMHEPLIWDDIADKLNDFKKKYILSKIIEKEIEEKVVFNWILKLKNHSYDSEEFFNEVNGPNLKIQTN